MEDMVTAAPAPPVLMNRPQRLGIFPTSFFWKDPAVRANPIVSRLIVPVNFTLTFSLIMTWTIAVHPELRSWFPSLGALGRIAMDGLAGGLIGIFGSCATFGVAERLLRRKILDDRRRASAILESGDTPAPLIDSEPPR
jgi:hypothetical protein